MLEYLDPRYIASYVVAGSLLALAIFLVGGTRKWVKGVNAALANTGMSLALIRQELETNAERCSERADRIESRLARVKPRG